MIRELRRFLVALQFLTRVPVPDRWLQPWDPDWLQKGAQHFPGGGALIGAVAAAALVGASQLWGPLVAGALAVASTVWLTGAFHEDGWADTWDGLGGAVSRERALTIMKDSRIGTYGAVGLVLMLLGRVGALAELGGVDLRGAALALWLSHALARGLPVLLLWALPYAGDVEHAKAKPMAQQATAGTLLGAGLWSAAVSGAALGLGLAPAALGAALLGLLLVGLVMGLWLRRRLGGYTGDTLGASEQAGELAVLLAVLAVLG